MIYNLNFNLQIPKKLSSKCPKLNGFEILPMVEYKSKLDMYWLGKSGPDETPIGNIGRIPIFTVPFISTISTNIQCLSTISYKTFTNLLF